MTCLELTTPATHDTQSQSPERDDVAPGPNQPPPSVSGSTSIRPKMLPIPSIKKRPLPYHPPLEPVEGSLPHDQVSSATSFDVRIYKL